VSSAFVQLSLARLRSFWREPSILFWSFGFPIVLAVALGIAFRNRPPEPVEVAVETSCPEETQLAITSAPALRGRALSPPAAAQSLRTGGVALVVACEEGGRAYHFDETRPDARNARLIVHDALERAAGRTDRTSPADVHVTEPGARYIDFLIPGLIGSNIMSAGLWGLGFTLVDMRVRNLLKRLAATPMKKRDFLASWMVVRAILVCIELPLLLLFAKLAFGVTVQGSLALLFLVCLLGSLVFAGFGVLVASRAKNTQTVSGLINLVSMPMYLCSGVFFSASRFPPGVLPWVRALPLTALIDSMRGIMTEGQGIREVAPRMAVALAWGIGAFVIALRGFRWR
jgi:ABC-type multidrug transport system permease subunit